MPVVTKQIKMGLCEMSMRVLVKDMLVTGVVLVKIMKRGESLCPGRGQWVNADLSLS